jgi:hypothetical protein
MMNKERELNDMTMRDHFAGLAMQGVMSAYAQGYCNSVSGKVIADWAYQQADEMLKAREVEGGR